jgi:hypothetical protein
METNKKPKNPSAFPPSDFALKQENESYYYEKGMTLRDYFANSAMQGICVNAGRNSHDFSNIEKIVETAYKIADAMLKQRELNND